MNIFVLDLDPQKCAEYHCDKHLCKMIVEHNQILGSIAYTGRNIQRKIDITPEFVDRFFTGFPRKNKDGTIHPYGIGYKNHPCTVWAKESLQNYYWLCNLTFFMCNEYTKRYGRKHACEEICRWYYENAPTSLPTIKMTDFAQAMPIECKNKNVVTAYRNYYKKHKSKFAKWAHSETPDWWI